MSRLRTTLVALVTASIAAAGLAAPAAAQDLKSYKTYVLPGETVGCSVAVSDIRWAYCTDLKGEMKPIPNSDGLAGTDAVGIMNGYSYHTYSNQGWGGPVDVMAPGSIRHDHGLIFVADFNNGIHVFDGVRYAAYVGNGQVVVHPGVNQLSSAVGLSSF
ncbi:hypothetical protein QP027_05090 [Corynebacterium breve]|uniref:Uncharacterized protein n=1 Tax=Corynebacterium breve TaxID=3049799 RepID=A0ABY8VKK5_9CORY|nr:hypothetical protein [Corynebacterium breve]WIM68763.1 hypothetical protein QP027_05090 [Corynebacterium breve]